MPRYTTAPPIDDRQAREALERARHPRTPITSITTPGDSIMIDNPQALQPRPARAAPARLLPRAQLRKRAATLQIPPDVLRTCATLEALKACARQHSYRLARQHHPDLRPTTLNGHTKHNPLVSRHFERIRAAYAWFEALTALPLHETPMRGWMLWPL